LFKPEEFNFSEKLNVETRFETEPISEAVWLNYLGDLLFQSNRFDEAERILRKSLASNERSAAANLLLGKVLMRQGKFSQAEIYFEKAAALDDENYTANYYLADALFREHLAPDGYVNPIPAEKAKRIRELLKKAVMQNPQIMEAYKMLASLSLANDDEIEESIALLQNALKIQPQNFLLEYNLAQLHLRRRNFEAARNTALKLKENCAEKDFCERVKSFISILETIERKEKEIAELRKKYGLENVDFEAENLLPPEEVINRALNRSLRKPLENEKRFVGLIDKIECGKTITFTITNEDENLKLSKPSFDGIMLISFSSNTAGMRIECGTPKTEMFVVATYKENFEKKTDADGELFVLEFVPKEFRLIE
jgi:tetratricopeptide (TPR) repeat protein